MQDYINNFKAESAMVQSGKDCFKVFIGPFTQVQGPENQEELLYKPDFWSFLDESSGGAFLYKANLVLTLNRQDFSKLLLNMPMDQSDNNIQWDRSDFENFKLQFSWIQNKIESGDLDKALPITIQSGKNFNHLNKFKILQNILQKNSNQYLYAFWNSTEGFIGFTPEVLVHQKENYFDTMAVAGTWSKKNEANNNFSDTKIKNEHDIVVNDITDQLKSEQLIEKSDTKILELEYLYHLQTLFKYKMPSAKNCIHMVQKIHPTAALGLFPRNIDLFFEFKKFALQSQRKNFGAPFGFVSKDESFLLVAIRNIFWSGKDISIYSGCGVTRESVLENEWQELEAKRNSVKETFGLNL